MPIDPDFSNLKLLLHGDGTNGGATITDSSSIGWSPTINGSVVTSNEQAKFGATSLYFDGASDWLDYADNNAWDLSGDFTLSMWVYPLTASGFRYLAGRQTSATPNAWVLAVNGTLLELYFSSNNSTWNAGNPAISGGTVAVNQWSHIEWSRVGDYNRLFINGTQVGSTYTYGATLTSSNALRIGAHTGTYDWYGYLDEIALWQGVGKHTADFTPPTDAWYGQTFTGSAKTFDPYYANLKLLLHGDGLNNSTNFIDSSPIARSVTPNGDVKISTAQSEFGASSVYFDGTGDYLSVADSSDWEFGSGAFTIEFWMRPAFGTGTYNLVGRQNSVSAAPYQIIMTGGTLAVFYQESSWAVVITGGSLSSNAWQHVALSDNGTSAKLFLNGTQVGSTYTRTLGFSDSANPLIIGSRTNGQHFNGYMDEIAVWNGVAKYTANFTPPNSEWYYDQSLTSPKLLLHCNGTNGGTTFVDSSPFARTVSAFGNVITSTSQSKFGGSSMYFDGSGGYLENTSSSEWDFGSSDFTIEFWMRTNNVGLSYFPMVTRQNASTVAPWSILHYASTLQVYLSFDNSAWANGGAVMACAIDGNVWTHIAVTRSGSTFRLFKDGVQQSTYSNASAFTASIKPLRIGSSGTLHYSGHLDEIAIWRGYAKYTSNFTPPTNQYGFFNNNLNKQIISY